MAKLVAAIDAKMYLDNFSLWRTILIGKEVDYYSTGRNPLGVRVPRPPYNNYRSVVELVDTLTLIYKYIMKFQNFKLK